MNQTLGSIATTEIRKATDGLVGTALKDVVDRLVKKHRVSRSHIYKMTADQRKGKRKTRADAGKRKFRLEPGTDVFHAASLVISRGSKLDPAEALRTAEANGKNNLPALGTFQTLLRENGLGAKARRSGKRAHHLWEAEYPLRMVQIDCTALKIRWVDEKTRRVKRIETVDKNHPQLDPTKERVWQIMAVDDHSRRRFFRYVSTPHITSHDMVEFLCDLCDAWGVPEEFYTDNGPEFKGFFTQAIKILSAIPSIQSNGGCLHSKHKPGNSQASGKVEVAHKWAEKMDRYIGLAESRGLAVTFDKLNPFADEICRFYNEQRVHRATGQTPLARWHGTHITLRKIDPTTIRQALLSDSFPVKLDETMTITRGKVAYAVPTKDEHGKASVFMQYIGQRVQVVIPHGVDVIFVTLPNGEEYQIDKAVSVPHAAGEFRDIVESRGEQLKRELQDQFNADSRQAKDLQKQTGEVYRVPFFNHEVQTPATNVAHFPHAQAMIPDAEVNEVTPIAASSEQRAASSSDLHGSPLTAHRSLPYSGKDLTYWQAVPAYADHFSGGIDESKEFLLGIFPNTKGTASTADIESAIDGRFSKRQEAIRLVG